MYYERKSYRHTNGSSKRYSYRVFLPIAIGQMFASAETLSIKNEFQKGNFLQGVCSKQYPEGTLKYRLASILDNPRTPKILALSNLVASGTLILGHQNRKLQIISSAVIAVSNRLSEFRTPYGRDGADQMTSVITQYRAITALIPNNKISDDIFLRSVNFQAALSYLVSGVSKAFGSSWIQGDALGEILQTEAYGRGPAASLLKKVPQITRVLTIGTVLWECTFPLIYLLSKKQASFTLTAVKIFHLAVAATMELPRFVWGFFGSHGAVEYVLANRGSSAFLEKTVIGVASAVTLGSAITARENRKAVMNRRLGPKGGTIIQHGREKIEYRLYQTKLTPFNEKKPTIILESGLGEPMESWDWIAKELAEYFTIVCYHRSGYGLTQTKMSNADIISKILNHADIQGEIIPVTHSIGSLYAATYVNDSQLIYRIKRIIIIDGTDPFQLETARSDRKAIGQFLQIQLHTLFGSVTGIYKWAPNAVERQVGYTPNVQFTYVNSIFSPKNILNAVKEYMQISTKDSIKNLSCVESKLVISSEEHLSQQKKLALALEARIKCIPDSAHKTILGKQRFALKVADVLREYINES